MVKPSSFTGSTFSSLQFLPPGILDTVVVATDVGIVTDKYQLFVDLD